MVIRNAKRETHLITITPREVLDTDILVGVFRTLLKRRHVAPMLPVLVPLGVNEVAATDQGRDDSTRKSVSDERHQ